MKYMPPAVVVDIDGTIANTGIVPKPYIHEVCVEIYKRAAPIEPIQRMVQTLARTGYQIVYATARNELTRDVTREWLMEHELWFEPMDLYMRSERDYRPDYIVKQQALWPAITSKYHVHYVLEDRTRCVNMYRELGATCLQVAPGDF